MRIFLWAFVFLPVFYTKKRIEWMQRVILVMNGYNNI
jgi:hypothetical protein